MDEAASIAEFAQDEGNDEQAEAIGRSIEAAIDLVSAYVSNNQLSPDQFLSVSEKAIDMVARKLGVSMSPVQVNQGARTAVGRMEAQRPEPVPAPAAPAVPAQPAAAAPAPAKVSEVPPESEPARPPKPERPFEAKARAQGWRTPDDPFVPVAKSVTDDAIICLFDGHPFKTLKKHLTNVYGMTPEQYRQYWHLAPDYPMVAKVYSDARKRLAQRQGFGSRPGVTRKAGAR